MISVSRWREAKHTRQAVESLWNIHKTDYPLAASGSHVPYAYLIEQAPNSEIRPHFHTVNQFQVILAGHGTLGRSSVRPVFCHYAGAYTGYGPIVSGVDGLTYLTLRPSSVVPFAVQRANYLPEKRQVQRNAHRRPRAAAGHVEAEIIYGGSGVATRSIISPGTESGPLAKWVEVAAGARHSITNNGCDAYVLVARGELDSESGRLEPMDLIYLAGWETLELTGAGRAPSAFAVLRFPSADGHGEQAIPA